MQPTNNPHLTLNISDSSLSLNTNPFTDIVPTAVAPAATPISDSSSSSSSTDSLTPTTHSTPSTNPTTTSTTPTTTPSRASLSPSSLTFESKRSSQSSPPPSPTPSIDLDHLHEEQHKRYRSHTCGEDFDDIDPSSLSIGDIVTDRDGEEWTWKQCYCEHPLCSGKAMRRPLRRGSSGSGDWNPELSAWDRGRPEEEE